mmetsp:Transcript_68007/g.127440  ORF Transcript_68007/g.127440 Transcript_68007/m.127440 type:complete len:196 (-) Transcript_68007:1802-2389(-)
MYRTTHTVICLQCLLLVSAVAFPWNKKGQGDSSSKFERGTAASKNGRQDVFTQLLSSCGLQANPMTLSILAGVASIFAVFLRQIASSAAASAKYALRKALYVEITVSQTEDARLYKALVRWMHERGMLDRVNRYKAVSTTLREGGGGGDRGGGGKGGGRGGGGARRAEDECVFPRRRTGQPVAHYATQQNGWYQR